MERIILMVIRDLFMVPYWFIGLVRRANHKEKYTLQEGYDFIRWIVTTVNRKGRVKLTITGVEKLPEKDGFIMFPNHQGMFDVLAIIEACPRPLSVIVKKEAQNLILVKQAVQIVDGMYMDRSDIRSSLQIIQTMSEKAKNGKNFIIFPEGTRSRDGNNLQEFKAGSFKSAVNAGCPIVPVALIDSFKPFDIPSIRPENVQVHILDPIYQEQYIGLKTKDIAHLVQQRIQEEINRNLAKNKEKMG